MQPRIGRGRSFLKGTTLKLYHGTTAKVARAALTGGLRPRGNRKSNWDVPSRADAVYLTSAYALHFATACANPKEKLLGIVEVESDRLNPFRLAPDEDFLEQCGRKHDGVEGDMHARTKHYRDQLWGYQCETGGKPNWLHSVEGLGNCAHEGPIPVKAITRIALVSKERQDIIWASDPTISLLNFRLLGDYYNALTGVIFDEEPPADTLKGVYGDTLKKLSGKRDGIEIVERLKEAA